MCVSCALHTTSTMLRGTVRRRALTSWGWMISEDPQLNALLKLVGAGFKGLATVPAFNLPHPQEDPKRDESLRFCKYATFFDPGIYEVAYRNVRYKRKRAVDDGFRKSTIPRVIEQMKNRSFQFQPVEVETIAGDDGIVTCVGRPSFTDLVVQEIFRMILEPVFRSEAEESAHAALRRVRTWTGTTWAVGVNAPFGLLSNLDHSVLGSIVMGGVKDQQLLDLYWKLVNAGLLSTVRRQERHNLTGVSKGGILWPVFTNAYLSGFDAWVKDYASTVSNPRPTEVHHIRYGDQWMVGVDGPKSLAVNVRDEVRSYLNGTLKLGIDEDCFTIAHLPSENMPFLGVLVGARDRKYVESLTNERARRAYGRIVLEAPINKIVEKLVEQGFAVNAEFPQGMSAWIHLEAEEILRRYTNIMKGLMGYYSVVDNKNMMRRVYWILRFSAIFTLCRKWRMSTRALFKKLVNDPQFGGFVKGRITSG